jgi:hypothetical protein
MFYNKVNSHAKAALAVKTKEQATAHSKMQGSDQDSGSTNAVLSHTRRIKK